MKASLWWLGLLLLCLCSNPAAGWRSRRLLEATSYKNLLDAAQSEVRVIQQLYNGVFREQGWANTEDFRPLLKVALNPSTNLTAFFPSDDSWQRVADYYCLTQQGVLDNISNLREMLANYINSHLIPNQTLHSSDFRDGLVLQSLAKPSSDPSGPTINHTLSRVVTRNGTVKWIFRNASIYRLPGQQYDYEDITVNPQRMDIKAGNAVIHVIDTLFRNYETERFWEGLRSQVLERAGLPSSSSTCPSNATHSKQEPFAPSQIAGMVIGVVIGLLLLAGVLMLIFVVRSHNGHHMRLGSLRKLSAIGRRRRDTDSSPPPEGDGESPASGSGDAFVSPLLHAGHGQRLLLTQQGSAGNSSSASWAMRNSTTSSIADSMAVRPDSVPDPMCMVSEESPFAVPGSGLSSVIPAAALTPGAVQRQPSSLAGDTHISSSVGGHRHTDSFGSGTPHVSRGSGHGSKKDLLAFAAQHLANGTDMEQFDSPGMGGALAPTESVPVGRINHEHVIPLSDLSLKELIGAGAEGKVYRGTWKHTDIAAKEYLPIEPAHDVGTNSRTDCPSDAAMAHARAALAKEVHWLTSLNHPNLVRFCAVCLERPLVVMEFYKHGSVFAMLQKAARELARSQQARRKGYVAHFNWDRRLEMLHDVAAGMSYLHGKDHVHGDLRSPNLFVGADGKVKIGDFGFTKRLACNTATLKVKRITHPRWVAPELMMDNMMSRASDVYSFGIIMYELLTFRIPFDLLGKEQVVINVIQGSRPDVPEEAELPPGTSNSTCLFTYVRLMKECWAHDHAARPSFEVIARRLKAMQRWRKIISKHSTLHRAASHLRQSSSWSSLSKEQQGKPGGSSVANGNGSPATGSGDAHTPVSALTAASGVTAAAPNGVSPTLGLSRARSAQLTDGAVQPSRPPMSPAQSLVTSQHPSPGVPEYSSSEYDDESLPEFEDFEDPDGTQLAASAPVSEAVIHGTRLAVIGVHSHQDDRDALASVAGAELALARKVVLVGSDLPAGAFARAGMRSSQNSVEENRSRRIGGAASSFTSGVQLDKVNRFHSSTLLDAGQRQQLNAPVAAAAAAALASAAAATAAGHRLPPNGKVLPGARGVLPTAAVPAVKTAVAAKPAPAEAVAPLAAAAAAAAAAPAGSVGQVPRRHSDPLPPKGRLSVEDEAAVTSPACPESGTAVTDTMSSGQSPFAFVHVGPPGLACTSELQQLQVHGQEHPSDAGLRLLQSYPLSNTTSEVGSPMPSAASTPDPAAAGWLQRSGKKQQQQQQHLQNGLHQQHHHHHLHLAAKQQQYRVQQQQQPQRGLHQQQQQPQQLQQQGSNGSSRDTASLQPQPQLPQQRQAGFDLQQPHPQQQLPPHLQPPSTEVPSAFEASGSIAAAAAAAAAEDAVAAAELAEVYSPFDSPFFQDLTWAPSASVCDMNSNPGSVSMHSSFLAAAGVVMASESGSVGAANSVQLQQSGLPPALQIGSGSVGSGLMGSPEGVGLVQGDSILPLLSDQPVLKQALTIEYQANLTPMAAAAAEAVSVHGGRFTSTAAESLPNSRPGSVVANGPHAAAAAAAAAAVEEGEGGGKHAAAHAAVGKGSALQSSASSSQADVAASADTGAAAPAATAAASVMVNGVLGGKAHSAPSKSPGRTTPVSDQSQLMRPWKSYVDAPRADVEACEGASADAAGEPVRPAWMRLLGIRRSSAPGGP